MQQSSTKVITINDRSEKIMLVSNEVAFSFIFLISNIYRTRGKYGDDKVYGDLGKTQKWKIKKASSTACLHDA
jgi:hypothetical protein